MMRNVFAALGVALILSVATPASADILGRAVSTDPDLFDSFTMVDPDYDVVGDMFGVRDRNNPDPPESVNFPGLPFAVLDDSASFPTDSVGIIQSTDFDPFFGVVDTVNGTGNDTNVAIWTFDISGFSSLSVSIDFAASGDFEDVDVYDFEVQIDGNGFVPLFTPIFEDTDPAIEGDEQVYTMEVTYDDEFGDPIIITQEDPMTLNGTRLNNIFQTFSQSVLGTGNLLDLRFSATSDGGSEAFAFRNLLVEGTTGVAFDEGDFDEDGDVDGDDFLAWQSGFGTSSGAMKSDGDYDNDGDVDGDDFLGWQSEFGNGGGSGAVPEPTAIALLTILGLSAAAMRYRNG